MYAHAHKTCTLSHTHTQVGTFSHTYAHTRCIYTLAYTQNHIDGMMIKKTCTHTHITNICTRTHTYTYKHTHAQAGTHAHTHTHTRTHASTHTYIHTYIHTYTHIARTHIHTQAYTVGESQFPLSGLNLLTSLSP